MSEDQDAGDPLAIPQIQTAHIDAFTPYARNARTHPPEQVAQLAASILQFGWTNPILKRGDTVIGAGHGRLDAARLIFGRGQRIRMLNGFELPAEHLPFIDCSAWSEQQFRAYVLADNRIAEKSGWDRELLTLELEELRVDGFDIAGIGFSSVDLVELFPPPGEEKKKREKNEGNEAIGADRFLILIECKDEAHQAELYAEFQERQLTCKIS